MRSQAGSRFADRGHLALRIELSLDALGLMVSPSAHPLIEGVEDADHPVQEDAHGELVSGEASQPPRPESEAG